MRTYETTVIIQPEAVGDAYTAVVDKFKGILSEQGASILAVEEWGTRKLAYTIRKQDRGTYVMFAYDGKPESIRELERRLRIDDNIIKFMTVQLDGGYEPSGFVRKVEEAEAPAAAPAVAEKKADVAEKKAEEKSAPAETEEKSAPAEAEEKSAPAEAEEKSAPAETEEKSAPAETEEKSA